MVVFNIRRTTDGTHHSCRLCGKGILYPLFPHIYPSVEYWTSFIPDTGSTTTFLKIDEIGSTLSFCAISSIGARLGNNIGMDDYQPLRELYDDLIRHQERWNYYYGSGGNSSCCIQFGSFNDLCDADKCRSLIISLIGRGGKTGVYLFNAIYDLSNERLKHIVSVFLLGIIIYEKIRPFNVGILSYLNRLHSEGFDDSSDKFKYIWLLACVFHDLGYAFEDNSIPACEWEAKVGKLPERPACIPKNFSRRLFDKYAKYRRCRFGVYDHGIYGAKVLYSNLCELREQKEMADTKHYWGKDLEKFYGLAAWIIACHNIWFVRRADKNSVCYDLCDLARLIIEDRQQYISSKRNALLFLFCLVDSLDFTKNLDCDTDMWSGRIKVNFSRDCLSLDLAGFTDAEKTKVLSSVEWLTEAEMKDGKINIHI